MIKIPLDFFYTVFIALSLKYILVYVTNILNNYTLRVLMGFLNSLQKEVQKIGVKPVGKKRMLLLLKDVYQQTHQCRINISTYSDKTYKSPPVYCILTAVLFSNIFLHIYLVSAYKP